MKVRLVEALKDLYIEMDESQMRYMLKMGTIKLE